MSYRLSLSSLFLILTVAAFSVQLVLKSDWMAAVGFVVAAFIMLFAMRWGLASGHPFRAIGWLPIVVAASLMWFVVVDYSISTEWCYDCNDHRFYGQYRICGIPLNSTYGPFHRQTRSRVRCDLGLPCNHKYVHDVRIRYWGLFYPARPLIQGTCCISDGPDYYTEEVSKQVRKFAEENPEQVLPLIHRITMPNDGGATHAFISKMKNQENALSE